MAVTSADIRRVVRDEIFQETLDLWLAKNEGYGEQLFDFDVRAQALEINRKNGKVKSNLWHGKPLVAGEQLEEVLMDLIGHCLITIARLRLEGDPNEAPHPRTLMSSFLTDGPCPRCGSDQPAHWCDCDED